MIGFNSKPIESRQYLRRTSRNRRIDQRVRRHKSSRLLDQGSGFKVGSINKGTKTVMATAVVKRIKKKLPDRIAEVRGDRSQRQFARDLGVFQQNVNRYENGTTPHTDFLITLAVKEEISLDWLVLGKGRMKKR
jgi:DNA-binding transcriptional regulator YiaG